MSDYITASMLPQIFRKLFDEQLDMILFDGVMPSAEKPLSKLLCGCYKSGAQTIEVDGNDDIYSKREPLISEDTKPVICEEEETQNQQKEESSKPEKMSSNWFNSANRSDEPDHPSTTPSTNMLAAVPYGRNSGGQRNNNHTFKIEDVTDDPEYSHYGGEVDEPEEGAMIEYCRLDKPPSIPRVCEASTVRVTKTPQFRMVLSFLIEMKSFVLRSH
ncbi:unnamed protein product, partial [Mesorhabditis belari]|uniref:Uncharacterized protein n=1 Tax=Mesorhabditis belari TaxID=2138241 RepID=A0AAF3J7Y9_9BILA